MSKEKRYRLLKDLPDVLAGSMFSLTDDGNNYVCYNSKEWAAAYSTKLVEENPTWFEEIKDEPVQRIEVTVSKNRGFSDNRIKGEYSLRSSQDIPEDKLPLIKQAIEKVLNNEPPMSVADIMRWQHRDEKERIAFNAGREMIGETFIGGASMGTNPVLTEIKQKYPTFEDYKKLNHE